MLFCGKSRRYSDEVHTYQKEQARENAAAAQQVGQQVLFIPAKEEQPGEPICQEEESVQEREQQQLDRWYRFRLSALQLQPQRDRWTSRDDKTDDSQQEDRQRKPGDQQVTGKRGS